MQMRKVLVLTDGKAGHENQSRAFARALGCEPELLEVHFKSGFHKALSYLFDRLGIRTVSLLKGWGHIPARSDAGERGPCAVLGTGSGTFYAAKALAKRLGVKCGVVLYPRGYDIASFDCVLAPAFDNPPPARNVVTIPANLVSADAAFYEKGVAAFYEHSGFKAGEVASRPLVAVIVGGPNKCSSMTADWLKPHLDALFSDSTRHLQSSSPMLCVTTSRRTPPEVEALVDSYPWDYKLLYSRDHFNPIPAFVRLAKRLYVTAESTGMLSEACTAGKAEVRALDNLKPGPHKFRRFLEDLRRGGYVDGAKKIDLSAQFAAVKRLLGL